MKPHVRLNRSAPSRVVAQSLRSSARDPERRKAHVRELHSNDRTRVWVHQAWSALYFGLCVGAAVAWQAGWWPLMLAVWAAAGHVGHSKLIAFHEASHGTLASRWPQNELQGILIGTIIFVPLSSYRYVHGQHHAYIGTERDLELWPFVRPDITRPWRVLAAGAELLLGFFYTPVVFLHGVLVGDNLPRKQRTRIILEYVLCAAFWIPLVYVVHSQDWWGWFTVGYLVPAMIAGNLQSVRKFTEHLGLLGDSILTTTRTVVDRRLPGEALSQSMLRIDHHGAHHRYAKVPYYNLPKATELVYSEGLPTVPVFPSYGAAMWDMARALRNPRVGAQWLSPALRAAKARAQRSARTVAAEPTATTVSALTAALSHLRRERR
jgi:fatty acid desaturase